MRGPIKTLRKIADLSYFQLKSAKGRGSHLKTLKKVRGGVSHLATHCTLVEKTVKLS